MTRNTILVSIMHTNNEVGSVQPIEQAGELIKRMNPNTLFHVDAVQGFGKFKIYPRRMNIDLLSVSAHKIHGPKGVGFLYISEKAKVRVDYLRWRAAEGDAFRYGKCPGNCRHGAGGRRNFC